MSETENVAENADKRVGRYIVRCPWNDELNPELVELAARGCGSAREYDAWLEDTAEPGRVVHADGGAPEDQTLHRDLSSLVDELNTLAAQIARLTAQNESYRIDNKLLCQQMEALRVQLRERK